MSMMSSLAVIFFVPVDWWMLKMDRSLDASLCAFEFITWYWWRFVWMPACANKYQLVCWSVLCVFLKYCLCMYTHIYAKHFTSYAPPPPHLQPLSDWSKCLYYSHLVYFLVIQFFAVELFLGFSTILVSLVLLLVFFECSICFFFCSESMIYVNLIYKLVFTGTKLCTFMFTTLWQNPLSFQKILDLEWTLIVPCSKFGSRYPGKAQ